MAGCTSPRTSHPITLTRKELYDKVWSEPVHTLIHIGLGETDPHSSGSRNDAG